MSKLYAFTCTLLSVFCTPPPPTPPQIVCAANSRTIGEAAQKSIQFLFYYVFFSWWFHTQIQVNIIFLGNSRLSKMHTGFQDMYKYTQHLRSCLSWVVGQLHFITLNILEAFFTIDISVGENAHCAWADLSSMVVTHCTHQGKSSNAAGSARDIPQPQKNKETQITQSPVYTANIGGFFFFSLNLVKDQISFNLTLHIPPHRQIQRFSALKWTYWSISTL